MNLPVVSLKEDVYSDGLHQAIEAKEKRESGSGHADLCNHHPAELFRMYKKLAGMTGTAETGSG